MATARHADQSGQAARTEQALAIYDRYVKPLEAMHPDEYAVVTEDGGILFDVNEMALAHKPLEQFGRGSYLFKVGEIAADKWLTPTIL